MPSGFANMNTGLFNLKKKFKNKFPTTSFPLKVVIFKIVNRNELAFKSFDKMRKGANNQGDPCYIFKSSGNEVMVPKAGVEDVSGTAMAVQTGEGDLKWVRKLNFDEASNQIVLAMDDDETMKYQFANACKEAAFRFRPEEKWYNSFAIGLIIFGILIIIMTILATTQIGSQVGDSARNLVTSMNGLAGSMNSFMTHLPTGGSNLVTGKPPG